MRREVSKRLKYCDPAKVASSSLFPDKYSPEQGTCWLCFVRLTGEYNLERWRIEPFFERKTHPSICPVCGYNRWKGGIWYPFKLLLLRRMPNPAKLEERKSGTVS